MTPEERQTYIDDLRHGLTEAGMNMEAWIILTSRESRLVHQATMNDYKHFFVTAINAHFVGMLLPFYRLFETSKGTVSIPTLLKKLRLEGTLHTSKLDELDTLCRAVKPLWLKVGILRNNAFGHRKSQQTVASVFQKAGITQNEFRDLFEKTKTILNTLTKALSNERHLFNLGSGNALLRVLEDLGSLST